MYQRILVPVDGSNTSMLALRHAIRFAQDQHAQMKIVHVVAHLQAWGIEGPFSLDESFRENGARLLGEAAAIAREGGIAVETALLESRNQRLSAAIVEEAGQWPADIILMGSAGHGGVSGFIFGSVADGVLRTSSVPVLLLPRRSINNGASQ